jgi:hypothetical protein
MNISLSIKAIVKDDENSEVIQAKKKEGNLFRSLFECFYINKKHDSINTIIFSIKYSENFHERILDIRAINGVKYYDIR